MTRRAVRVQPHGTRRRITGVLLNRIRLDAVGGNDVTSVFMVTEVYVRQDGTWKPGSLSFTRLLQ